MKEHIKKNAHQYRLLGLLVILNPFSTMEMLVMAIGVVIIYNGASNLWIESRYRKL